MEPAAIPTATVVLTFTGNFLQLRKITTDSSALPVVLRVALAAVDLNPAELIQLPDTPTTPTGLHQRR